MAKTRVKLSKAIRALVKDLPKKERLRRIRAEEARHEAELTPMLHGMAGDIPLTVEEEESVSQVNRWDKEVRTCALAGCGKTFKPVTQTQFYHDDFCAAIAMYRKDPKLRRSPLLKEMEATLVRKDETREAKATRMRELRVRLAAEGKLPVRKARTDHLTFKTGLPVGTSVTYLGGSKASWLKEGATGTITRHHGKPDNPRYAVRFGSKSTVLGGKYLKEIKTA